MCLHRNYRRYLVPRKNVQKFTNAWDVCNFLLIKFDRNCFIVSSYIDSITLINITAINRDLQWQINFMEYFVSHGINSTIFRYFFGNEFKHPEFYFYIYLVF